MTLGDKIKKARTESGMTQSELAGEHITRNMLSQIENNTAIPSIPTIKHISNKLNIPAGYFLTDSDADSDDEFIYKKMFVINDIKEMFKTKQYQHCIDLCLALKSSDDEIEYILSNSYFALAYDSFISGNLKTAETLFTISLDHAHSTVYTSNKVLHYSTVFIDFIKSLNNNLIKTQGNIIKYLPYTETMIYLNIVSALNQKQDTPDILNEIKFNDTYIRHIEAKKLMIYDNYIEAERLLSALLTDDLPLFERYMIIIDMESCYAHLDDFKNAYKYSTMKNELYTQMFNN